MTIAGVTEAMATVLDWIGTVITALTGEAGELAALAPFFQVTIGVSAIMLGIKVIRGFVWGA